MADGPGQSGRELVVAEQIEHASHNHGISSDHKLIPGISVGVERISSDWRVGCPLRPIEKLYKGVAGIIGDGDETCENTVADGFVVTYFHE